MPLTLVLGGIALAAASGLPAFLLPRRHPAGQSIGTALLVAACGAALTGAVMSLAGREALDAPLPWPAVGGGLAGLDPLGAFFVVPIFLVGGLASVYSLGYRPQSRNPRTARSVQLFYGIMTASMGLVVVARDAIVFLLGWEAMALSAFFLVGAEGERAPTRRASLVFLVATHASTLALFCMFALWRAGTGSFALAAAPGLAPGAMAAVFVLGLVGFGLKAGVMPLHFWLPGAHAAAPSHVSAVMSGVLLKMGIYGLLRLLSLMPSLPPSWGGLVLVLGASSALLGVALALAQHDVKRLLAYHSVENVGIILMGLALAMAGRSLRRPELVALGLGGCLLHTWNHGLFKSLLFLCAGSVARATGTRRIDRLGGLSRGMPLTALLFLVGAVAICGLPPLNGFVSELLVYLGLFGAAISGGAGSVTAALAAASLAMVGALAVACFVKVAGVAFLGEPRSPEAARARESPPSMIAPMAVLALACVLVGLAPGLVAPAVDAASSSWALAADSASPNAPIGIVPSVASAAPLGAVGAASAALLAASAVIALALSRAGRSSRARLAAGAAARERPIDGVAAVKLERPPTWDCGYAEPTSRMQYTASSFARSLVGMFAWAIRPPAEPGRLRGAFPGPLRIHAESGDPVLDRFLAPAFRRVAGLSTWLRRFQQGLTQHYVLYLLVALLALLATLIPLDGLIGLAGRAGGAR